MSGMTLHGGQNKNKIAAECNRPNDQMSALNVYDSSVLVSHAITSGAILHSINASYWLALAKLGFHIWG